MLHPPRTRAAAVVAALLACTHTPVSGDSATSGTTDATTAEPTTSGGSTGGGSTDAGTTGEAPPERATLVHSFGVYALGAHKEPQPCVQWTLHNEEAVYVNAVTLVNDGGFHHSNWFVVPEDLYPGDDGYWACGSRDFDNLEAAVKGTVLFAQSTQTRHEVMALPQGVVIKVPPRHKVLSQTHLLNLGSSDLDTELRLALDIIHPRDVEVVVAPIHLDYRDLQILADRRTRFTGDCAFASAYEGAAKRPLDVKLYYVLPHYHGLGEYFRLEVLGGPQDGEVLFQLDGFNGGANGRAFDPPVDLAGADGLRFACGYDNWTDKEVGYGVGDQEMCAMLGLADARVLIESNVLDGSQPVGVEGDVTLYGADCANIALLKNAAQQPPTQAERDAPLYVPPTLPGDVDLDPVKPCVDSDPAATPLDPPALTTVRDAVFAPSCTFSSCHDASAPAVGLDLQTAAGLHARLLGHTVVADTPRPLVAPGDPAGSWLFELVSRCDPADGKGQVVTHMPYNAPTLLPDDQVATVRAWIAAGALDD